MILSIRSQDSNKNNAKLFQSIDYVEDGSKVYFPEDRRTGHSTSGHIFQYFKTMQDEATVMIEGLGVYLATVYSPHVMNCSLTVMHWNGNLGWQWDSRNKVFITPEEAMVKELVKNDVYASILEEEEKLLIKEEKGKRNKKSPAQQAMEQQELELIQLLQNPDLDPIVSLNQPVQTLVDEVEIPTKDQQSAASSLTFHDPPEHSIDTVSVSTPPTKNGTSESIVSGSTLGTVNTNTLRAALETGDTAEEKMAQLQRLTNMRMHRLKQREERLMAELLTQQNEAKKEHNDTDTEARVKEVEKQLVETIVVSTTQDEDNQQNEKIYSDMLNPNETTPTSAQQREPASSQKTGNKK